MVGNATAPLFVAPSVGTTELAPHPHSNRPACALCYRAGQTCHVISKSSAHDGVPSGLMAIINWSLTYFWVPWFTMSFTTA